MLERVMIISGESSGELYGAFLAGALKARHNGIRIAGVGGDRMQSAGVELISRISSSFGATEALRTLGRIRNTFKAVVDALKSFNPQVLVLIDYPDFNLRVAKAAKKTGTKVLYYVSPQVWAWRSSRVGVIAGLVDKMAVILPFEEEIYRRAGVSCEFVGHPVMDEIMKVLKEAGFGSRDIGTERLKTEIKKSLGLAHDRPVMAIMPGSRPHEISRLLPVLSDVVVGIKKLHPDFQFVVPVAPNLDAGTLSEIHNTLQDSALLTGFSVKAILASDAAVIASGTSTLQASLLKVPMTVVYKLSPLSYFLGRLVVKVRYISLANLLLERSVEDSAGFRIKELLQRDANAENILKELDRIIVEREYRHKMIFMMEKIFGIFEQKKASPRAAEIVEELWEGR